MPSSTTIIQEAEAKHADLAHKELDWRAFYTGYLEGRVAGLPDLEAAKTLIGDMLSVYRQDDKTSTVTAERVEAWQAEYAKIQAA